MKQERLEASPHVMVHRRCGCCGHMKNVKLMTFTFVHLGMHAQMPQMDWLCISCIVDAPSTVRFLEAQ
jgi:hypothetical protein